MNRLYILDECCCFQPVEYSFFQPSLADIISPSQVAATLPEKLACWQSIKPHGWVAFINGNEPSNYSTLFVSGFVNPLGYFTCTCAVQCYTLHCRAWTWWSGRYFVRVGFIVCKNDNDIRGGKGLYINYDDGKHHKVYIENLMSKNNKWRGLSLYWDNQQDKVSQVGSIKCW